MRSPVFRLYLRSGKCYTGSLFLFPSGYSTEVTSDLGRDQYKVYFSSSVAPVTILMLLLDKLLVA